MAKQKKVTVGASTYNITWLANLVLEGKETLAALEAKCPAEVAAAVTKAVGKEQARPDFGTVTLYGRITRRTEKAILFRPNRAASTTILVEFDECWLPLSQVKVIEAALADLDGVRMPGWLLDEKNGEVRRAN